MKTIAYSYVRFSTPDQAKGDSLRRQTEAAADWCKRHGATLDKSTTFQDLGKSAFLGEHQKNTERYRLAVFLKLVEDGKVPEGAYLILENLDRLTREHIQPAMLLVLNLLQKDIRIVQLRPAEMVFDKKSGPMEVMMMMMELSRGHGESARKHGMNTAAWGNKRKNMRERGAILTRRLPAWIEERDGKLVLIAEAARAVRRIFSLCNQGYGVASILRQLAAERIAPISERAEAWGKSYVHRILTSRAAIGEMQPMRGRKAERKNEGAPVPDYFPAVVSVEVFEKAQGSLSRRADFRGPIGKKVEKLFAGLLIDASSGTRIWIKKVGRGKGDPGKHVLTPAAAVESRIYGSASFPYLPFEKAVLALLAEISPADVLGGQETEAESVGLVAELADLDARRAKIRAALAVEDVETLILAAGDLDAKRATLAARLTEARQKEASPVGAAWAEAQSLLGVTKNEADRIRLRDLLRQMIEEVYVLVVPQGQSHRLAFVQLFFREGKRRDYLIYHRVACNHRRPYTGYRSVDWTRGDKRSGAAIDLRVEDDVKVAKEKMAAVDIAAVFAPPS
jgi:DNA invertase Pin-like site-specific DNA recombinase